MNNKTIMELRPSKKDEARSAAEFIYSSGPSAFDFVFKNDEHTAIDFLEFAFGRAGGEFSYKNHFSLYYDDDFVGIGSIFGQNEARSFTLYDARKILHFYKWRSFERMMNGLRIERLIHLPGKNEIAVAHLGIRQDMRGRGLGEWMIRELIKKVQILPGNRLILDVSEQNPRAQKLYERMGFQVVKKNLSTLKNNFAEVPHHFRMEMDAGVYL